MFRSQYSQELSQPGEKPVRLVVQTRSVTYRNDEGVVSKGTEIVDEIIIRSSELAVFDRPDIREMNRGLFEKA
jgi:hypothetical protein